MSVPVNQDLREPQTTDAAAPAAIEGRSLRRITWQRLRRDRVALGGGLVILALIVIAAAAPLIVALFGHPPNEFHESLVDADTQLPRGGLGGMSTDFLFGIEPVNGRDLFSRVLYGARISLLIAFCATLLSVVIGTALGLIAGYFGGWTDAVIGRVMDIFLAFPLLVFALALVGAIPNQAFGLSGDALRIALLIFIVGFFNWPYIGRIIRGQTISLRERDFIEAARSLGAGHVRILVAQQALPPHRLIPPQ